MKRHYFWLFALALGLFAACNKKDDTSFDAAKQATIDEERILDYISKNNITGTEKDTSGVYFKVIDPGQGDTAMSLKDRMNITYEGKLLNGYVFDKGDKTTLGDTRLERLIPGWQYGLRKITKGGTVQLFIPSRHGYGQYDYGDIPGNSVLVFQVTLHNFYF
ncbi:FKBP-type peptidyl-prolyl cis-trans isomerase [Chitinophaga lutea]